MNSYVCAHQDNIPRAQTSLFVTDHASNLIHPPPSSNPSPTPQPGASVKFTKQCTPTGNTGRSLYSAVILTDMTAEVQGPSSRHTVSINLPTTTAPDARLHADGDKAVNQFVYQDTHMTVPVKQP